jgi:hypothetical protein
VDWVLFHAVARGLRVGTVRVSGSDDVTTCVSGQVKPVENSIRLDTYYRMAEQLYLQFSGYRDMGDKQLGCASSPNAFFLKLCLIYLVVDVQIRVWQAVLWVHTADLIALLPFSLLFHRGVGVAGCVCTGSASTTRSQ